MPFTCPLSVTVGHERIRFQGEGHRSIADRRLHMLLTIHKMRSGRDSSFLRFRPRFFSHATKNSILIGVFEVKIFGTTYGLAVIHFLVLAAKRLVVSKNFVSQTPFRIEFWSEVALSRKSQR